MGADVPERARAGQLLLQAPGKRRHRVEQPVLQVDGPDVADGAEAAVVDDPLRELDGRDAPVVEVDHRNRAGLAPGADHVRGFVQRVRQRLLAVDVLAGLEGRDDDVMMQIAGRRDVDQVNVVPRDELAIVGLVALPAKLFGCLADGLLVAPGDGDHLGHRHLREERFHLPVRV